MPLAAASFMQLHPYLHAPFTLTIEELLPPPPVHVPTPEARWHRLLELRIYYSLHGRMRGHDAMQGVMGGH